MPALGQVLDEQNIPEVGHTVQVVGDRPLTGRNGGTSAIGPLGPCRSYKATPSDVRGTADHTIFVVTIASLLFVITDAPSDAAR